ncbi:hypothetical protein [Caballeronia sp. LZ032]|uniref:hypothetical protein n=1 Tax=Caballeronia sp. LZ032 TaxID=3038565 RepID=UPI002859C869|nr:hypothetical protein [Caballeronia sp. LZ032]MDR5884081.1 hypothetical protein [Caballeronia sp. LZ032]
MLDDALRDILALSAEFAALTSTDDRFEARTDAPGYVYMRRGSVGFSVPYYLAPVWPSNKTLAAIEDVLPLVRMSDGSCFCLSGSSTFLGVVSSISDIDCCEYFLGDGNALFTALEHTSRNTTESCLLVTYKIKGRDEGVKKQRPFGLNGGIEVFLESNGIQNYDDLQSLKLDFVASLSGFGVLAVTNLVVPMSDALDEQGKISFQYQEAVAHCDTSAPLRGLVQPADLGRYLCFLVDDAKSYIKQAHEAAGAGRHTDTFTFAVKSLKRMMSWLVIIDPDGNWGAIADELNNHHVQAFASAKRAEEARSLLDTIGGEIHPESVRRLRREIPTFALSRINEKEASLMLGLADDTWTKVQDMSSRPRGEAT